MSINWTQFSAGMICICIGFFSYIGYINYGFSYALIGIVSLVVLVDWAKQRTMIDGGRWLDTTDFSSIRCSREENTISRHQLLRVNRISIVSVTDVYS
jgi:hypothetical protein